MVEQNHFTNTANKLFMTQSGVSQHIKKLEQQLDTQLLLREGKSFSLTNAGEKLYQSGGELLQSFEALEAKIKADSPYEGVVKIASPGSVGLRLYPFLLELQQRHPSLISDYAFAPNKDIVQRLRERSIDLGLCTELSRSSHVVSVKVADEALVLVTAKEIEQISWQTLLSLGFVSHPDAAHHSQLLLEKNYPEFEHVKQFTHKGFSNQISLILEPVSRGLGFTVLPEHAAKAFYKQENIKIHHLPIQVSETLYLSYHRGSALSARSNFVKEQICNYLSNLT